MLLYSDIMDSFTIRLNKHYPDIDIYTTEIEQGFEDECFLVQLVPLQRTTATRHTDQHSIMIDIKYLGTKDTNKIIFLDKLNELQCIFNKSIQVNNRVLKFDNVESSIYKDDVGYVLSFTIDIKYHDDVNICCDDCNENEEYELMNEVYMNQNTKITKGES